VKDDPGFSVEGELTRLEEVWMDRLRPLAPAGYNTGGKIRE